MTENNETFELMKYRDEIATAAHIPTPTMMNMLREICADFANAIYIPDGFKGKPAAVLMAVMRGRELGLSPVESLIETFWLAPGGRLGMYANKMLDLMHRGGVETEFIVNTAEACEIIGTPPQGKPFTARFEFKEAERAGLVKKDSNWEKWPSDMCKARCVARLYRALSGTFDGGGNFLSQEELEDDEPIGPAPNDQGRAEVRKAEEEFRVGRVSEVVIDGEVKTETKSNVVEMPQQVQQEPIRAETVKAPVETTANTGSALWGTQSYVKDQIEHLRGLIGSKTARPVNRFVKGYLNVSQLPNEPEKYAAPLNALAKLLEEYGAQALGATEESATMAGAVAAGHQEPVHPAQQYFTKLKWSEETQKAAKALYAAMGFVKPEMFWKYATEVTPLASYQDLDAAAFCRIVARVRDCNDLLDLQEEALYSPAEILRKLEVVLGTTVELAPEAKTRTIIEQALNDYRAQKAREHEQAKGKAAGQSLFPEDD